MEENIRWCYDGDFPNNCVSKNPQNISYIRYAEIECSQNPLNVTKNSGMILINKLDIVELNQENNVLNQKNNMLNQTIELWKPRWDELCLADNCVNKYSWCGCPEL